ncbi:hypothetical protein HAX54_049580 [Datura stramonium]|uniref:Uncharacterized protein n=1 Tax=Datura stramonium TaxID=4076 RepID=A0ABS8SVQ3_DATST|nr:hypothetical protein [Datura stramonium]
MQVRLHNQAVHTLHNPNRRYSSLVPPRLQFASPKSLVFSSPTPPRSSSSAVFSIQPNPTTLFSDLIISIDFCLSGKFFILFFFSLEFNSR